MGTVIDLLSMDFLKILSRIPVGKKTFCSKKKNLELVNGSVNKLALLFQLNLAICSSSGVGPFSVSAGRPTLYVVW